MNFEELNLAPAIVKAVLEQGYETPTAIQAQAIPAVLEGHDLLGGAQTGTGKTAAFVLPMLHKLSAEAAPKNKFGGVGIRALVLTPTRELAAQVEESVQTYGKYLELTSTVVFGGVGMNPQISRVKKGVDILVATPGRLLDLLQQGVLDLGQVQILVLDEADRMLDMGFINDIRKITARLPEKRQTMLFSATAPAEIRKLAASLLHNPVQLNLSPDSAPPILVSQSVYHVKKENKKLLLTHVLQNDAVKHVLIFTRTKHGADKVVKDLLRNGIKARAIHGNKSQSARDSALKDFKDRTIRVLVATDVASRGIDVDKLTHVINYEIPEQAETYVHRIGRTGRAGETGAALSFCSADEKAYLKNIHKLIRHDINVVSAHPFTIN